MQPLINFYKCYRAYVRGKVETFHQNVPGLPEQMRSEIRARAERYFRLALQYVVCGSDPILVVVMGRAASGKSTLARSSARELGWEVFSSDHIRKDLAGVPLYKRSGPAQRGRLYSRAMTERTYGALRKKAIKRLLARQSVILDATFSSRQHPDDLKDQLGALGIDYCFVEAQASEETLKARLFERDGKLNEVSDARMEDFELLSRSYEAPTELEPRHHVAVSTNNSSEAAVVQTLKQLTQRTLCEIGTRD